jgi:hypothetical protein
MFKPLVVVPLALLAHAGWTSFAHAAPCTAFELAEIKEPARSIDPEVKVRCDLTLASTDRITKRLILEGPSSSNLTIDCNGALLDGGSGTINENRDMIEVRSRKTTDANGNPIWEPVADVRIAQCNINGAVRIWGMGKNGEATDVRTSSRLSGHVARVRAAAPRRITFEQMTITALGRTPFYISPGVQYVTLQDSEVTGESTSVGVYLDTESMGNEIRNNYLHVTNRQEYIGGLYVRKREELAIDNSTYNKIINNYISSLEGGGIYLYRNCGEGGTVRHGTPSHNQIINNTFYYNVYGGDNPSIHVGSRGDDYWRIYCDDDEGFPWGSSVDNRSFARYNVVMQNQIFKRSVSDMIKQGDSSNSPNYIQYNQTVTAEIDRRAGCYVANGYKNFILDGERIDVFKTSGGVPVCSSLGYECNDGELEPYTTSGCTVERTVFDCQVSGNNAGCSRTASCPAGRRIVAAVGACNLEASGSVTDTLLGGVDVGFLSVLRASDDVSSGRCWIGSTSIRSGSTQIATPFGASSTSVGCDEHDENGGDCHIRGALYCR